MKPAAHPLDALAGLMLPETVAVIAEADCIGCVKCIQACPFDAIIGAAGQMHTVVADLCTGCRLCIAPCPVDCIRMQALPASRRREADPRRWIDSARQRYLARTARLERQREAAATRPRNHPGSAAGLAERQAYNRAAVQRVREKRSQSDPGRDRGPEKTIGQPLSDTADANLPET